MRDTGCTELVIRSSLVSKDRLLERESDVTLINETTQRYRLAMIDAPLQRVTVDIVAPI